MSSVLVEEGLGEAPAMKMARAIRKKRSGLEVTADVLEAARNGARKTSIMYRANLSYDLLNRYLQKLVDKNLLLDRDDLGLFWVSPRGVRFLREFKTYERSRSAFLKNARAVKEFLE